MAQSTVKLIVDAQNAIAPLKRVNQQTQALSSSTDKLKGRLDKSNRSLRDTGRSAKQASSGVKTLTGALGPLLKALAVAATARFIFVKTAELETQRKSLEVLTGSLEKTNEIISELQQFSAVTPFTSSELIDQTKRLKAFGFETEELVDTTRRLSEVAGATGADLQGIATAFGQIRAKGKLQQEENLQLLERGVDITTELKRITGLQGDAFEKAQRQGKIGADLVNQALINLTNEGGKFFGGATKQADTLNGQVSTLVDNVEKLAVVIGKTLTPALKTALTEANKVLSSINRLFASEFQRDISKLRLNLEIVGGTNTDLKNIKNFVDSIPEEGINLVNIDLFQSQLQGTSNQLKNVASEIQKQRPFGLSDKEIANFEAAQESILKKINALEATRKKINNESKKTLTITNDIKNKNNENVVITENTLSLNELFNTGLEQTNFLVDGLSLGTNKFADKLLNVKSEADKLNEKFMEIGQGIEQGIVSNLTDAVMGTKTLAQAAIGVLDQLKRKLVEVAIQKATAGLGNTIGGFLGGLFGGGGGGGGLVGNKASSFLDGVANPFARANGGPVSAGGAFVVGEKGPEILQMGSRGGNVIPNKDIGGTTNIINVSVDASGSSVQGNEGQGQALGQLIAAVVQTTIVQEQRAGGLLNR